MKRRSLCESWCGAEEQACDELAARAHAGLESEGVALTHARWRTGSISGRGSIVSRRQPDGTWLIVLDDTLTP